MFNIITDSDHVALRSVAEEVSEEELKNNSNLWVGIIQEMVNLCGQNNGFGLAAPQIGISKQIIVYLDQDQQKYEYMINPKITLLDPDEGEEKYIFALEACLSLPGLEGMVRRNTKIEVSYVDINCEQQTKIYKNQYAIVLQHEIDHLEGILFVDRVVKNNGGLWKITKSVVPENDAIFKHNFSDKSNEHSDVISEQSVIN